MTGILKNLDSPLIEINSVRDHDHVLFAQSKNHAPAKIVEQVKTSSSVWIKKQHAWYDDFAWQGLWRIQRQSHARRIGAGIHPRQPDHHKQEDFQTEYRRFSDKNARPLDERNGVHI